MTRMDWEGARRREKVPASAWKPPRSKPRPRSFQWGKGAAVCPRCLSKIARGEWVKPAPGIGRVFRHVDCPQGKGT